MNYIVEDVMKLKEQNDMMRKVQFKEEGISEDLFTLIFKQADDFHETLLTGLPNLVLTKVSDLNLRIELLSQKTIRDKILSYFRVLSENNFSKTFMLPFSLTDLADYLSIDRSAMMRELRTLKEDGFIKKLDKNRFMLLNQ